ncbi:DUF4232 domain-containing protein [Streptomyces sp. TRM66268-LWL]|uniref:DUF4232 domain-containing protein n=1 Tax=Streptomyces polyasparticus TaxID=2767826 RepID=A0ABR7SFN1_9ACTN|nr:DUF4232 domain-containing protein [Streptomyces polyasparticus]MBC9714305.1 DUF4232 domain-containing protein [Streptomyces polyasparticus]
MRTLRRRTALVIAGTAVIGLALTGCSDSGSGRKSSGSSSSKGSSQGSSKDSSKGSDKGSDKQATPSEDGGETKPAGKPGTGGGGKSGPCTNAETKLTVTAAPRPVNYQLLTLTNTSKRTCTVLGYPTVSFAPDLDGTAEGREDTKPQAVVTLKPGASAYAGLNTSPADQADDGTKSHAKTVSVDLIKQIGNDGSTVQFGQPDTVAVNDLFIYEPKVTYWQQDLDVALS